MGINERLINVHSFTYIFWVPPMQSYTVLGTEVVAETRKIGFYFHGSYILAGEQNNIKV